MKRHAHQDDKKHSDYPSSIDDRRSRTPDEDIDDMDDDDDAMSNDHGTWNWIKLTFHIFMIITNFACLRNGNKHDDKF